MPRNSSGVYTLPAGNPVVTGTTITSTWANTLAADIGNELTSSLDRNGRGSMLAPLRALDGTAAAPGYTFTNEPSTGFFRSNAATLAFTGAGALMATMSPALVNFQSEQFQARDANFNNISVGLGGQISAPSISVANNLNAATISTTGVISAGGAVTAPSFNGAVNGNAATATRLLNARTINGVSFDGTANITVADNTKLPLTGGTITGNLAVGGASAARFAVVEPSTSVDAILSSGVNSGYQAWNFNRPGRSWGIVGGTSGDPGFWIQDTTAGQRRFSIAENGHVGIGVMNAQTLLQVGNGAGTSIRIRVSGASGPGYEFNDGNTAIILGAANIMDFYTSGILQMRLDNNGNFGIGTTSPGWRLDVQAPGTLGTAPGSFMNAACFRGNVTNNSQLYVQFQRVNNGGDWTTHSLRLASVIDVTPQGFIEICAPDRGGGAGGVTLGAGGSPRLFVNPNARVGIGTPTPATIFHIDGGASGVDTRMTLGNAATTIQWGVDSSNNGFFHTNQAVGMSLGTAGANRIWMSGDGAVAINTIGNPFGAQFHVASAFSGNVPSVSIYNSGVVNRVGLGLFNDNSNRGIWVDAGNFQIRRSNSFASTLDFQIDTSGNGSVAGTFTATSFIGNLNASSLNTGTIPDARFPATLPAVSGVNLTNLNASNLASGSVPAARISNATAYAMADGSTIGGLEIGFKNIPRGGDTTVNTAKRGRVIVTTSGLTIPSGTFAADDTFAIYNNSASSITITQGGGLTMYGPFASTGNRTLAARGWATIWFNSASECKISGEVT